ncbi:MAG: hypothetical protein GX610_01905 [Rhodococcus sp.]|nr:hypothetical protein [Rhodococcus sp. (in: high G+C Gram-positive bacteria)]
MRAAAVMALPLAALFTLSTFGEVTFELSMPWLIAVAAYGIAITVISGYPFDRIKSM